MATRPRQRLRAVTVEETASAPVRFVNARELSMTPAQVFEVLADETSWPWWAPAITRVTWTSPMPIGVGTKRTVDMRGGIVADEEFIAWDPPREMAFYFTDSNAPGMQAFAEHYTVVETASGSRLTWTLAMWPEGAQRHIVPVVKPVLDLTFAAFLRRLDRYGNRRYPA